jgi:hypothetical protein
MNKIGATVGGDVILTVVTSPPTFNFTTGGNALHMTLDKSSTIYSSTNLIDWTVFATNVTALDVAFTNKLQFFKAGVPTPP